MNAPADFAAALDAIITDPELRRELDRAPEATLAKLGMESGAAAAAPEQPALFAPPYVPVGPSAKPAVFAPPYVPVGPSTKPAMFAPPYVPVGPRGTK